MQTEHSNQTIDIFCRVIDNFGDAGVMWRLARAMRDEGFSVRLIIDEPETLKHLAGVNPQTPVSEIGRAEQINVCLWEKSWDEGTCPLDVAEVVIEGFACRLPAAYQAKMPQVLPKWFNIDYFSAEDWIEECHLVPSIDPASGIVKINYFPGVTERSGSLIIEQNYEELERLFKRNLRQDNHIIRVLYFGYPYGPIEKIAEAFESTPHSIHVSAARCPAGDLLIDKLNAQNCSHVTCECLPFVAQKDFDRLLWANDIAFIRGEDSAARAMIAGTPFLWHIYHQDENAHMVKLQALESRIKPFFKDPELFEQWSQLQEAMNNGEFDATLFRQLIENHSSWKEASLGFARHIRSLGSLNKKLSQLIKNG